MVNVSDKARKVRFDLSQQGQLQKRRGWKVQRMTPEGVQPELETKGVVDVEMEPHSVQGYLVK